MLKKSKALSQLSMVYAMANGKQLETPVPANTRDNVLHGPRTATDALVANIGGDERGGGDEGAAVAVVEEACTESEHIVVYRGCPDGFVGTEFGGFDERRGYPSGVGFA